MPMTIDGIKRLKEDEGFRADVYLCPAGFRTIGYGHNLDANPIKVTPPISNDAAEEILLTDIIKVEYELNNRCYAYVKLIALRETARIDVLINMAFNMGVSRLLGFIKTLNLIIKEDYNATADEMLNSKWAEQVGRRADRLSIIMRTGKYYK